MLARLIAATAVAFALSWAVRAQDTPRYADFLREVSALDPRATNNVPIEGAETDPATRLQQELGLTAEEAESVLAVAQEYQANTERISSALRRAILNRRLASMEEETPSLPAEAELIAESKRSEERAAVEAVEQAKALLGETALRRIDEFIASRKDSAALFPSITAKGKTVARKR